MPKPCFLLHAVLLGWLSTAGALPGRAQATKIEPEAGAEPLVQIGVRVGYSRYSLSGAEADLRAAVPGSSFEPGQFGCAGLVVRGRLAGPLALQGEMLYLRRGGRYTVPFFGDSEPFEEHSLQVPLLLNLRLLHFGAVALHVEGGYAVHLALSGPFINQAAYPPGTRFEDKGVTYGPAAGGELNLRRGSQQYFLHFRYCWEQNDFFVRSSSTGQAYGLRNQGFIITTGVLFGTSRLE